jgi:hypothetical protein
MSEAPLYYEVDARSLRYEFDNVGLKRRVVWTLAANAMRPD